MNNNNKYTVFILFIIGIITRLPFLEKVPSHWDAAEWSIAVVRYSLHEHTPTPPGYPLYIAFGKLFYFFVKDPHLAIVLVSVLFSGIGVVVLYITAEQIFNRTVGLITSLLFLSGPTFYFFGITANPYGILPTTAALISLLVYRILIKKKVNGIIFGALFAFSIGIRPQDAIFLTPLFVYGLILSKKKNILFALASCFLFTLLWLMPLLNSAGGLQTYLNELKQTGDNALPGFSFEHLYAVRFILVKGLFLSFGLSLLFLISYGKELYQAVKKDNWFEKLIKNKKVILFFLWITPSLLFNMFIRSDHAAHQMTYLTALLLLISYAIWLLFYKNMRLLLFFVSIIILFNLYTFFRDRDPGEQKPYIPQSYHYSEIRKNDVRLSSLTSFINQKFTPQHTLIISTEPLWRPLSYYLKPFPFTVLFALDSTDASYQYIHNRIDSSNWNLSWYQTKQLVVTIPQNISTVIFTDDSSYKWIRGSRMTTYKLPENSSITTVSVRPGDKIYYGYHSIRIQKKS